MVKLGKKDRQKLSKSNNKIVEDTSLKKVEKIDDTLLEKQILEDEELIMLDRETPPKLKKNTMIAFYSNKDSVPLLIKNRCNIFEEYNIQITPEQLTNLVLFFWMNNPEIPLTKQDLQKENEIYRGFNPMDLQNLKDLTLMKQSKKKVKS